MSAVRQVPLGPWGLVPRRDPQNILANGYLVSEASIRIRLIEAIRLIRQGHVEAGRRLASACWYAAGRAFGKPGYWGQARWLYIRAGMLAGQPRAALLASVGMA